MTIEVKTTLAQDIAALVRAGQPPQVLPIGEDGAAVLVVPKAYGNEIVPLEPQLAPFRTKPKRRDGVATMLDLDSFVAWVNRHKDADSVIFADPRPNQLKITAVIDYNKAGEDGVATARFGTHRASYTFQYSRIWKAWQAIQAKTLIEQAEFARILEDRIAEILPPPPKDTTNPAELRLLKRMREIDPSEGGPAMAGAQTLLALARGLEIHENSKLANAENVHSGARSLRFESNYTDGNGEALNIPTCFAIACPVFELDVPYMIPIRLRFRKSGAQVKFSAEMYDATTFFEDAIKIAIDRVIKGVWEDRPGLVGGEPMPMLVKPGVDLPLFLGSPEAV